jgi:hypothetical protein
VDEVMKVCQGEDHQMDLGQPCSSFSCACRWAGCPRWHRMKAGSCAWYPIPMASAGPAVSPPRCSIAHGPHIPALGTDRVDARVCTSGIARRSRACGRHRSDSDHTRSHDCVAAEDGSVPRRCAGGNRSCTVSSEHELKRRVRHCLLPAFCPQLPVAGLSGYR